MEELEYYREVRNDVYQEMDSQKDTPHLMFYGSSYVFSDEMLGENRELEYFMCLCYVACGLYELEHYHGIEPIIEMYMTYYIYQYEHFGKYKDMTLKEVIIKDWQYVKWAIIDSQHLYTDVDKVLEYHMENRPTLGPNDIMSFGKYKGKSIEEVCKTDRQYLIWLSQNNDSFNLDWEKFK